MNSGSILLRQCRMVYLTSEHLDYVSERYTNCLCAACLKAVRAEYDIVQLAVRTEALAGNMWRRFDKTRSERNSS